MLKKRKSINFKIMFKRFIAKIKKICTNIVEKKFFFSQDPKNQIFILF